MTNNEIYEILNKIKKHCGETHYKNCAFTNKAIECIFQREINIAPEIWNIALPSDDYHTMLNF